MTQTYKYIVTYRNGCTAVFHIEECALIFCRAFGATMQKVPDFEINLT